ncbi:dephospho-CoA kinase [Anaerovorax odorimutans]|uniref:Dephospho-CoA kinase n=1 Tax=Anaerovorax odorimutans TaxID=109327 RepID=A0ABT1RL65_9FIRM|nr:dephospho-CoA kinase [Anaerovorax odorimutans]MCQ4635928.1 dephospho-CoA kinase [Anaerovorax odorimutans]
MEIIGLTGGIGTGKSTASAFLAERGFAIIDADKIARAVVEPGEPLLKKLEVVFGEGIIKKDGSLDRKGLAAIVFTDKTKRQELDRIMHGTIIRVIDDRLRKLSAESACRAIVIDAPLLFETGLEKKCSQVWVLTADQEIRIQRVCRRDGTTPEEVRARISSQLDDDEKKRRADMVIDNSGSRQALENKLQHMIDQI